MKKFKIPICPKCKKELLELYETVYEKYNFNNKTGRYDEVSLGDLVIECGCGANINEIFIEGACNYQAQRRIKND
jgi:hypothetical protein